MNIRRAAAARLLADAAIKSRVGTRVYRGRMPENLKPPHIIVWLLRNERPYDQDGYTGLSEALLQISCFSYDPDEAMDIANLVKESMESWPAEAEGVRTAFIDDESDGLESETEIYHVPLDVKIKYHEEA